LAVNDAAKGRRISSRIFYAKAKKNGGIPREPPSLGRKRPRKQQKLLPQTVLHCTTRSASPPSSGKRLNYSPVCFPALGLALFGW
jgi:hypothetical protein